MMNIREADIRKEIAYYEAKANENDHAVTPEQRSLREHYMRFAGRRKQLLAAFLDGRPEAWQHYSSQRPKAGSNDGASGTRT